MKIPRRNQIRNQLEFLATNYLELQALTIRVGLRNQAWELILTRLRDPLWDRIWNQAGNKIYLYSKSNPW